MAPYLCTFGDVDLSPQRYVFMAVNLCFELPNPVTEELRATW